MKQAGFRKKGKDTENQKNNPCHGLEYSETPGNFIPMKTPKRVCGIPWEGKGQNGLFCFVAENTGPL